jgi:hypothetical protein
MLPNMRNVAAVLAKDASENLAGVDVISVGPLYAEQMPGGMQYSVVVIVPERGGTDFAPSLATFRRKNRIFGSTQAHSKAEKPHRNARWGGFEVVN